MGIWVYKDGGDGWIDGYTRIQGYKDGGDNGYLLRRVPHGPVWYGSLRM